MAERLMACGFTRQMADDIIYLFQDDLLSLSVYVCMIELLYKDRMTE